MVPNSFYGLSIRDRFFQLLLVGSNSTPEQKQQAFQRIKAMPYPEFLDTIYWKTVRDFVVERHGGNCQSCLSARAVNVHHRTYENHGREHLHLGDLMPVCRTCHEILHEKIERGELHQRIDSIFRTFAKAAGLPEAGL